MNNISKSIGWAEWSWNPITGCLAKCDYCYARAIYKRFKKSFKPQFHYDRLNEPAKLKQPSRIFVCSVSDFWGQGVKPIWREEVYNIIKACPQHTFFILTKQPQNINDYDRIPDNVWVGVSVSDSSDDWRIRKLRENKEKNTFISAEPYYSFSPQMMDCEWLIIGGLTGKGKGVYSINQKLLKWFIETVRDINLPVYMKSNLKPFYNGNLIQEKNRKDTL